MSTRAPKQNPPRARGRALVRRSRDATATRAAILGAARAVFASLGYEAAGVREIAGRAGVTAALVNRYFGSKKDLFVEAVLVDFPFATLLDDDRALTAERLAQLVVTAAAAKAGTPDGDPLQAMLRSAADPEAGALVRDWMQSQFIRVLARWLGGTRAEARAALLVSMLMGYAVLREILIVPPLVRARERDVVRQLAAGLHAIMMAD